MILLNYMHEKPQLGMFNHNDANILLHGPQFGSNCQRGLILARHPMSINVASSAIRGCIYHLFLHSFVFINSSDSFFLLSSY